MFIYGVAAIGSFFTNNGRYEYSLRRSARGTFLFEKVFPKLLKVSSVLTESLRFCFLLWPSPVTRDVSEIEQEAADILTSRFCRLSSALTCCLSLSIF